MYIVRIQDPNLKVRPRSINQSLTKIYQYQRQRANVESTSFLFQNCRHKIYWCSIAQPPGGAFKVVRRIQCQTDTTWLLTKINNFRQMDSIKVQCILYKCIDSDNLNA